MWFRNELSSLAEVSLHYFTYVSTVIYYQLSQSAVLAPIPWIPSCTHHNASQFCEWWQFLHHGHNMRLPTHLYPVPRLSMNRAVTHWPCISSRNAQGQINLHLSLIKYYLNNTSDSSPTDGQYHAEDTMAKVVQACMKHVTHTHTHKHYFLIQQGVLSLSDRASSW